MLREVYRTVPLVYPSGQTLMHFTGIHVGRNTDPDKPNNATPFSPTSVYVFTLMDTSPVHTGATGYYKYDGVSGQLIRKIPSQNSLGAFAVLDNLKTSRTGVPYAVHLFGDILYRINLGKTAMELVGDETTPTEGWSVYSGSDFAGPLSPDGISIDRFAPYNNAGDKLFGYGVSGSFAIDDSPTDRYLDGTGDDFRVWTLSTGEFRYGITMPDGIVDMALEDATRVYILLANRNLVLFDYERGEALGAVKLPSLVNTTNWTSSDVRISWDMVFKRVLVAEVTPNNPDGTSTSVVRGFRSVPEPTRITPPIPLKVPRRGRIIPVLVQVLGDMNEGVGGYHIDAVVQGSGSLVGVPVTDHNGNGIVQVACEGSDQYVPSPPFDYLGTGSPEAADPNLGLVNMVVSTKSYRPDPADVPITGVQGSLPFGGIGPPVDATTGNLPATAPNMIEVLRQVQSSRPWRLDEIYEDEPDGRGAFTEAAVTACHDRDARFGHVAKHGTQNQYNGHAVDALNFLCDDGTTAEIYDIVTGGTPPGLSWNFTGRSAGSRGLWYYPA